ncbi:terminase large subunit domain-containing protein [Escherichia coli]
MPTPYAVKHTATVKRWIASLIYEFTPYSKQREFIDAGHDYPERCFMAGNQLGKSFTGAAEVAFHLTGRYPGTKGYPADGKYGGEWKGKRFYEPVVFWIGGETNETVRGQNISAQNAALSREIQRAELQEKALDRQIARESNQLKLEELKQKQADVRQKADIARADRQAAAQGAVDTFSTALDSLNEIEQSPGLSKAVGIRSAFPTVPGSDAANFEARLDTFKAQTFLPMVQSLKGMGALSDAEGKKLSDAVGALSPKMSEKAFRDSIGKIRNQLESKLSTVKKQFDYQEPVQNMPAQQPTTGSNFSSLWGD